MKLQCLSKCQHKCSVSDEIPCGMSLFKKACQFIFLFLLADRGILSNWLGALPIASSRYCWAGIHRCQRRPVWGFLCDSHDRHRSGHPGGKGVRLCASCSSAYWDSKECIYWCPNSPQGILHIKMSQNPRSFQVGRAHFWLGVSEKTSGNGSMFIPNGEILPFKWPWITSQS